MKIGAILSSVLSVSATFNRCVHPELSHSAKTEINEAISKHFVNESKFVSNFRDAETIYIPIYVHVITTGEKVEDGNIPIDVINAQIDVLKHAFASAGVEIMMMGITRTASKVWATQSAEEYYLTTMTRHLRKGGPETLNLYVVVSIKNDVIGVSSTPFEYKDHPALDGVRVAGRTLPGGTVPTNLGFTAVHEIGHWMGLFHIFEGGCSGPNDGVLDTPAVSGPAYGCPVKGTDSCPNATGFDDVTNFMGYTDDQCMDHFTSGQIARMRASWNTYRKSNSSVKFYEHSKHKGKSWEASGELGRCMNVPSEWNDRSSSHEIVGTDDACVILYQHGECVGNNVGVQTSPVYSAEWNDEISSFRIGIQRNGKCSMET